jgi:putative Holliday junction resolvase
MSQFLSLDFGLKRVGVAYCEAPLNIAYALTTVNTEDLFKFLETYIKNNKVSKIIVGNPKSLRGEPTHSTEFTHAFFNKISIMYQEIDFEFYDERFTSKIAKQTLLSSGVKKMKRRNRENIDKISAVIILQDYLQSLEFYKPSKT